MTRRTQLNQAHQAVFHAYQTLQFALQHLADFPELEKVASRIHAAQQEVFECKEPLQEAWEKEPSVMPTAKPRGGKTR